ncbi:MAG: hypothetical protein O4861_20440 [Trichodesmium sp. St16_bin4-tuft]|nr:hypothetical protein [Trichodesmium sp. MAG_R01]MDE5074156.1 hypothetical protein [Trichodesmium sp. St5_bin8]MDE5078044.1 hypothetical protein [Trichodesmium sp. St2_bin6]MDE5100572.1 hypothetical protein [Trichodesmium sp. St16_bin4-tuft]MDE5104191.1 hypothetical protein [Trichodesmium sp. St19_bin2]
MTEKPLISALAEALLTKYDFDLGGETSKQLIARWEKNYQVEWLSLAVIEALYLGRYKAISVQQILTLWERRGQPIYHFNSEFQNIITRNVLTNFTTQIDTPSLSTKTNPSFLEEKLLNDSKFVSLPSNPFELNLKNKTQNLMQQQVPAEPYQYKIKHTDFYTKLKTVLKKSQALQSHPKEFEQENDK